MNKRAKGNKAELRAVKELEAEGFLVYRVPPSRLYQTGQDIFSIFDMVAKKASKTIWLQIKSNRKPNMQPFKEFKEKWCNALDSVQVWVWVDREGFTKIEVW